MHPAPRGSAVCRVWHAIAFRINDQAVRDSQNLVHQISVFQLEGRRSRLYSEVGLKVSNGRKRLNKKRAQPGCHNSGKLLVGGRQTCRNQISSPHARGFTVHDQAVDPARRGSTVCRVWHARAFTINHQAVHPATRGHAVCRVWHTRAFTINDQAVHPAPQFFKRLHCPSYLEVA